MLACPLNIEDIDRKADGYWMEPKLDGIRCLAAWDGRMYSRSAKTDLAVRLPHIAHAVRELHLPQGVWLDGEVGYPAGFSRYNWPILDFNATVRVTGSSVDEALRKQDAEVRVIQFHVFDCVNEQASRRHWPIIGPSNGVIYQIQEAPGWDEDTFTQYVLDGGEGVILKNPEARYQPGKRPARTWYKIKKFESTDGVIIDYDPGQGKYSGQLGALVVKLLDGTVVRASGMNDGLRMRMSENFEEFRGRWVEIKYFGRVGSASDGYRHPQFLRFRADLDQP
jgi:ATP-dependent DNA ligase